MKRDMQIQFQPIGDDVKASEAIYMQIRQMIMDGQILPGSRLPSERKMMEMVQKSRSSVREAMRMLERDGYIQTFSRSSGAVVQEPGVENTVESLEAIIAMQKLDIANVLEFRRQTENVAAQLAAQRRTDEDLKELKDLLEQAEQSMGDVEHFIESDLKFHLAIAQASKNGMYVIMLHVCRNVIGKRLKEVLSRGSATVRKKRYENIITLHRSIYTDILEQNGEQAFHDMEEHLFWAEQDILKDVYHTGKNAD